MSTVPETSKGATKQDDGPITFHLEEHGNVPVTVQGLSKDELKEWEPFKVRIVRPPYGSNPLLSLLLIT